MIFRPFVAAGVPDPFPLAPPRGGRGATLEERILPVSYWIVFHRELHIGPCPFPRLPPGTDAGHAVDLVVQNVAEYLRRQRELRLGRSEGVEKSALEQQWRMEVEGRLTEADFWQEDSRSRAFLWLALLSLYPGERGRLPPLERLHPPFVSFDEALSRSDVGQALFAKFTPPAGSQEERDARIASLTWRMWKIGSRMDPGELTPFIPRPLPISLPQADAWCLEIVNKMTALIRRMAASNLDSTFQAARKILTQPPICLSLPQRVIQIALLTLIQRPASPSAPPDSRERDLGWQEQLRARCVQLLSETSIKRQGKWTTSWEKFFNQEGGYRWLRRALCAQLTALAQAAPVAFPSGTEKRQRASSPMPRFSAPFAPVAPPGAAAAAAASPQQERENGNERAQILPAAPPPPKLPRPAPLRPWECGASPPLPEEGAPCLPLPPGVDLLDRDDPLRKRIRLLGPQVPSVRSDSTESP